MFIYCFDCMDGSIKVIIIIYVVYGIVIDFDSYIWSCDLYGSIEMKLEECFDSRVIVFFFNFWSGDMINFLFDVVEFIGSFLDYDCLEAVGNEGADLILEVLVNAELSDVIVVRYCVACIEFF